MWGVGWLFGGFTVNISLYHIDRWLTNTFARMIGEHLLSFLLDADLAPVDALLIVGEMWLFVDLLLNLIWERPHQHASHHVCSCMHLGAIFVQARQPTTRCASSFDTEVHFGQSFNRS